MSTPGDPPHEEWSSHEEVQLLDQSVEEERGEESTLRKLLERSDRQIELLEGISTTLTRFLKEWEAANTEPSHAAVKVILTWGEPQDIPKGD